MINSMFSYPSDKLGSSPERLAMNQGDGYRTMQEERWVETTYLQFTFCKHWHLTSLLFGHALLKIVQKLSSACPSNDLSLFHLLWQSLIQDAGWQSHASRGVWERMWVDIANYITLIVVALIYGTVRNNFCAIIQCDIWYHAVSTSIISIWIVIFRIVGFHGYRLLFYLQIELAVSSGASLSRLEAAPLGSGRSSLPPLLFLSFFFISSSLSLLFPLIPSPSFSSPSHIQHNSHSNRKRPSTWIWICWHANSCQEGARLVDIIMAPYYFLSVFYPYPFCSLGRRLGVKLVLFCFVCLFV